MVPLGVAAKPWGPAAAQANLGPGQAAQALGVLSWLSSPLTGSSEGTPCKIEGFAGGTQNEHTFFGAGNGGFLVTF